MADALQSPAPGEAGPHIPDPVMPRWVETATAILLSVAGLSTAWASYQASLWGGEQVSSYSAASAKLTESSQLDIVAGQMAAVDTNLFLAWADAAISGDTGRAAFLTFRFSPTFSASFAKWRTAFPEDLEGFQLSADAKPGSFMPTVVYPQASEAAALRTEAARLFAEGEAANSHSDRFIAVTVLLSTVLFLGGISQVLKRPKPRIGMVVFASLICLGALGWLFTLPASHL